VACEDTNRMLIMAVHFSKASACSSSPVQDLVHIEDSFMRCNRGRIVLHKNNIEIVTIFINPAFMYLIKTDAMKMKNFDRTYRVILSFSGPREHAIMYELGYT